jgi:hypothetical protein
MSQQVNIKLSEYALMLSNGISNGGDKPVTLHLMPEHMSYRRTISELIHRCICLNPAASTLDELSAGVNELSGYAARATAEIAELKAKVAEFEKEHEAGWKTIDMPIVENAQPKPKRPKKPIKMIASRIHDNGDLRGELDE